jgi:hypothetical protein
VKYSWNWILLAFFSIAVVATYLYFEIALIIKLYLSAQIGVPGELKYHEPLGLFAPVIYFFEGGIKILEGLSPLLRTIRVALLFINSILLVISIPVSYFVFKQKIWAGIVIVLLSVPLMMICFEELSRRM